MASTAEFQIIYDGPALENNEMDAKDLAPSLLALAETIEETNKILNHNKATVVVNVKGSFKTGCFAVDINVIQNLVSQLQVLWSDERILSAAAVLSMLGINVKDGVFGLIQIIQWLQGRQISNVVKTENGKAKIYQDEDSITVEMGVLKLLESYNVRVSVEKTIAAPLERDGVERVVIGDAGSAIGPSNTITKDEKDYFIPPKEEEEPVDDVTYTTRLQLVGPVFLEGNKWRFTEGDTPFYADVCDGTFVSLVQESSVSFARGDILTVKMQKVQKIKGDKLSVEYRVLEVLNHKSAHRQIRLPWDEKTST